MTNWTDPSDDEMDDFFRKISEKHSTNVWEDAWPNMEEKLDKEDKKRRFIVFWRSTAAILLLLGLGTFSKVVYDRKYNNQISKNANERTIEKSKIDSLNSNLNIENNKITLEKPSKNIEKNDNKQITNNTTEKEIYEKNNLTQDTSNELDVLNRNIHITKNENAVKSNKNTKHNSKVNTYQLSKIAKNTNNRPDNKEVIKEIKTQILEKTNNEEKVVLNNYPTEVIINNTDIKSIDTETKESEIIANNGKLTQNPTNLDTVIVGIDDVKVLSKDVELNSEQPFEKIKLGRKILKNFTFSLGVSPDYSSVMSSKLGDRGGNYQFLVDYSLGKRTHIKGGVIRSKKYYDAYPEDYVWPVKWGIPSSPLKEIEATCDMLDFPLIFTRDLVVRKNNMVFSSLGLTSYKMMNEKYIYLYENDSDPNLKRRKWEGSSGFFAMSVINFSVGYERKISKNLSIQFEPFIKMPIKNVGFGKVKLLTTGMFFNIKTPLIRR
jgi:hypothetical protein